MNASAMSLNDMINHAKNEEVSTEMLEELPVAGEFIEAF